MDLDGKGIRYGSAWTCAEARKGNDGETRVGCVRATRYGGIGFGGTG